ncbi:MAG: hypothetical protein GXO83_06360 [Chlorobi bacterium]|nr:hypothetical protein [Chlorobiota bacterium]
MIQAGWAQTYTKVDIKQKFVEGNSFFLFEEYLDALPYYLDLIKIYPDNDNLNYRIGICYLNIPGEKDKAISYLEKASKNINPKYRENSIREKGAPMDVFFYLGNAYRVNNQLDKALEMYRYFIDHMNTKVYKEKVIDMQIQACLNAKKLQEHPLYLSRKNMGNIINSRRSDYGPIISGDEKSLAFMRKLAFYDAVFFSQNINGQWTPPINLTPQLGVDQDFYTSSFSYDGKIMYLYKNDEYDGNIYISRFVDGQWTRVIRLNDNINTKYWESHASVTKDGQKLYFTSNRKGGYGGLDIYQSVLDSTGNWGPAENLGPIINTEYNEETPFITVDGTTLFFSSYGHFNMGGYDIFYSNLLSNGEWSVPVNMGYPINTTDDDIFYQPIGEGYYALYSMFSKEGFGDMDIFRLEIFSAEHPRKFLIKGMVSVNNVPIKINEDIFINLLSKNFEDTIKSVNPDTAGKYQFETFAGDYNLTVTGEGFVSYTKPLSLPNSLNKEEIDIPPTTLSLSDLTAELEVPDTVYNTIAGDTVNLLLNTEKGSWLTIRIYQDSVLLDSIRYFVTDDSLMFPILPPTGASKVLLTLQDKFGNLTTKDLYLNVTAPPPPVPIAEVKEHELRKPVMTPAQLQKLQDFLDILKHYSSGDLYKEIEKIDPVEMNLTDQYAVINFLKRKAEVSDYTPDDVDQLLVVSATRKAGEVEDIYSTLVDRATGNLQLLLKNIDLEKENIHTPERLFSYLEQAADSGIIDSSSVKDVVVKMATEEDPNLPKIYKHLSKFSEGQIKTAIENISPEQNEIYSAWELSDYLLDKSSVLGYTPKDLIYLFAQISTNGNPDLKDFLKKLKDKASDPLLSILDNLDIKKQKIRSIQDLMDYLMVLVKTGQLDNQDILKAMMRIILSSDINEEQVRKLISKNKIISRPGRNTIFWIIPIIIAGMIVWVVIVRRKKKRQKE